MEYDITVKDGQILLGEKAMAMLAQAREIDLLQKKAKVQMDAFKEALHKAMEDNGLKKLDNDILTATYIGAQTRQVVDTNKLKAEGLYELYTKPSNVKSSVKIEFKEA